MTLTSGQTSDYEGVAMLLDYLPQAKCLLADRGMMPHGLGMPYTTRESLPVYLPGNLVKPLLITTKYSTSNDTKWRTCLGESRTGGG